MNITVIMLGLLGDVLMRTPVLRELKKQFPSANILCVVDPIGAQVLRLSPDVDGVLITSRSKKNKLDYVIGKIALHLKMFRRSHDWLIDLYDGESSRRLVHMSRAKKKLLLKSGAIESKGLKKTTELDFDNSYHMSNVQMQVLAYLDATEPVSLSTQPHIVAGLSLLDLAEVEYLQRCDLGKTHFLISMGSGSTKKIIQLSKIARLCRFIADTYHLTPVVLCNPGQEYIQQEILQELDALGTEYVSLQHLSIAAIAYLMQKVSLVLVPDTGLFHLAVGIGTPILGIFTHTNPELVRPDKGEYEICFKVDPSKDFSVEDLPYGTHELPDGYLQDKAKKLIGRLGIDSFVLEE